MLLVTDVGPPLAKLSPSEPNIELRDDSRTESLLSVDLVLLIKLHISTTMFLFSRSLANLIRICRMSSSSCETNLKVHIKSWWRFRHPPIGALASLVIIWIRKFIIVMSSNMEKISAYKYRSVLTVN